MAPALRLVPPPLDAKASAWRDFETEVERLYTTDPEATTFLACLEQWGRIQAAYAALKAAWVTPRKAGRKATGGHDMTLTAWLDQRGHFLNRFYGFEGKDGKRPGAHDPEIRRVIKAFQELWGFWRKQTPTYIKAKKAENRRRNQLASVKQKKAEWNASPEGVAWRAKYLADAKAKRAEARIAKKAAKEALRDV